MSRCVLYKPHKKEVDNDETVVGGVRRYLQNPSSLEAERNTQHGAGVLYNTVPSFVRLIACLHASLRQAVTAMGRRQSNICNSQQDVYTHDFSIAKSDRRMLKTFVVVSQ